MILTCIIIETNREGPSALGFPCHQNLFPQKLHQDKAILFMEHRSLAILIPMLLIGKVAAGDIAFFIIVPYPKPLTMTRPTIFLISHEKPCLTNSIRLPLLRALSQH